MITWTRFSENRQNSDFQYVFKFKNKTTLLFAQTKTKLQAVKFGTQPWVNTDINLLLT